MGPQYFGNHQSAVRMQRGDRFERLPYDGECWGVGFALPARSGINRCPSFPFTART